MIVTSSLLASASCRIEISQSEANRRQGFGVPLRCHQEETRPSLRRRNSRLPENNSLSPSSIARWRRPSAVSPVCVRGEVCLRSSSRRHSQLRKNWENGDGDIEVPDPKGNQCQTFTRDVTLERKAGTPIGRALLEMEDWTESFKI